MNVLIVSQFGLEEVIRELLFAGNSDHIAHAESASQWMLSRQQQKLLFALKVISQGLNTINLLSKTTSISAE